MKASCTNVRGGFLGAGPVGSGALRASSINGSASRFCGSGLRLGLEVRSTRNLKPECRKVARLAIQNLFNFIKFIEKKREKGRKSGKISRCAP